jgi:tetratricopeptide (TPR) repeat protein
VTTDYHKVNLTSFYSPIILLLALFLAACQQPLLKTTASEDASASIEPPAVSPLPFKSGFIPPKQLSEETIYHYLAAEISIQRQQLDLAYEHFMLAASLANDKTAAEKAARIALLQNQTDEALHATAKWIDYDPNSVQARQLGAILHLRNNDLKAAEKQFDALLQITDSRGSNGFLRIASLLASEKDKQRNLLLMQELTARHPKSAQAHYAMALVEFEAKQFELAMNSLEQAKLLDPSWDKPYVLKAQILASQGNNQAAEISLKKAVRKLPKTKSLHQAYGRILVENQQYKQAIKAFKKSYELEPSDLDMLYAIGVLAMQAEDWDTARSSWSILLNSDDREKRNDANYFLGQVEELNHNPDQAMKYYMAVGKGKIRTESRLRLARLMAKAGQLEKARVIYAELRVLNDHDAIQIYAAEAQTLKELGLADQAVELYTTALGAYPENMDLRYARGLYAADRGDIDLAVDDFKFILSVEPENADTLNALGYTLADQTDRYQEALNYILKAHQLKPDNPAILDSLGWVLYRLGKNEEALKYLHKAAIANPDAEIAAHLGEVLWMMGNRNQAEEIWNNALTAEPDSKKLKEVMRRLQSP